MNPDDEAVNRRLEDTVVGPIGGQPIWDVTVVQKRLDGKGPSPQFRETFRVSARTKEGAKALAHEMRFHVIRVSAKEVSHEASGN